MPDIEPLETGKLFVLLEGGPLVYRAELLLPKGKVYASYADVIEEENKPNETIITVTKTSVLAPGPGYEIQIGIKIPEKGDYVLSGHSWEEYESVGKRWGIDHLLGHLTIWRRPMR